MRYTAPISAFAVASLSTLAAAGTVIKNQCSSPIYVWTVTNTPGDMQTVQPGSSYSEDYLTNPDGGGVSVKIATVPDDSGAITQFEYTLDGSLWYDISNINGYPFMNSGLTLVPSSSSCTSVTCEAGVELCSSAYNTPDENAATHACTSDGDTTVVLCSGQQGSTPVASASDIASATTNQATSDLQAAAPTSTIVQASSIIAAAVTATAVAPVISSKAAGGVATTFATQTVTVVAGAESGAQITPAPVADGSSGSDDWSFFHHPASLGADWGFVPDKRDIHKRAAHRHHFHRHANDAK